MKYILHLSFALFFAVTVANAAIVSVDGSGVKSVSQGGTNSSAALSGSSIMVSNGSAIVQGTAGTSVTVLHGNASGAPTYGAVGLTTDVTGVLPVANGGTGGSSLPAAITYGVTSLSTASADIQSVYFGSSTGDGCVAVCTTGTCAICKQIGTGITSVTYAGSTGQYNINGIDGTKYNCVGQADATTQVPTFHARNSSTASLVRIVTNSVNAGRASVICFGVP